MDDELATFYDLLEDLERRLNGKRLLRDCHGRMGWPRCGVYFFFEKGERRRGSGRGLRVVRVGTHAIRNVGNKTTLWNRLYKHKRGNEDGSVFCELVGNALKNSGNNKDVIAAVRNYIGAMPFLWVAVNDESGPNSHRAFIERNAIGLLGAEKNAATDPASRSWLGHKTEEERIIRSGLWNKDHVEGGFDPKFLNVLKRYIKLTHPLGE